MKYIWRFLRFFWCENWRLIGPPMPIPKPKPLQKKWKTVNERRTRSAVNWVSLGVYKVFWKSGGSSGAIIGQHHNGERYIACFNWTSEIGKNPTDLLSKFWDDIEKLEKIIPPKSESTEKDL